MIESEQVPNNATRYPLIRTCAAWSVHLLTALGAVVGLKAMVAIEYGAWRAAFLCMGLTIAIDSVDGALARKVGVKQVLPGFDGALLDNIVDYFTYVIVPAFFLYQAGIVPLGWGPVAGAMITLASGYQFCQSDAKTPEHYFKGFPSYWNLVVFYLFLLDWPRWLNFGIILCFTIMIFVPFRYIYPTRTVTLRKTTLGLAGIWGAMLLTMLFRYPEHHLGLTYVSLVYVAYYHLLSLYLTVWRERKDRPDPRQAA
jgi:phosphatidylcholine synthase